MNQQHPQPPKKRSVGKTIGIGCGGAFGLLVVLGIVGALVSGGDDKESSGTKVTPTTSRVERPATDAKPKTEHKPKTVVLKVWGTAPAGALGPMNITYGSDNDTRQGTFKNGEFTTTLPLHNDALYYTITAQLQGSGDINCSVTITDHTEKAHASGGYNICHAQANKGIFGGWD
ncbi:hypothetical protein [Streptomyces acidiscabies]|uniref:Uncharacterized protein n=1 Tax=Streptomyces acidiscabies TaxID=42234 RepID=A0AAP6EGK7_9ACTN|nr:hypothetical protein [Streptomyces acidiscabies]MDX2961386.1 hypothetical protein [Streptomyces acidiscabies]MDX3022744.1 hypothetical protein [Streptomyces acidiscabies]MDX3792108.1 hypothetical protein [Streptomyces acidiscabies]GAQ50963.1 hypothetical protein a10_00742 [Streptomyces acidiscabies]GAV38758.1 hypothetical protein Saa2_01640 [Streptomyces acidiscabies]